MAARHSRASQRARQRCACSSRVGGGPRAASPRRPSRFAKTARACSRRRANRLGVAFTATPTRTCARGSNPSRSRSREDPGTGRAPIRGAERDRSPAARARTADRPRRVPTRPRHATAPGAAPRRGDTPARAPSRPGRTRREPIPYRGVAQGIDCVTRDRAWMPSGLDPIQRCGLSADSAQAASARAGRGR